MSAVSTLKHPALSERFNADEPRVDWHDATLWWIREKRDKAAHTLYEDWESLRNAASAIKDSFSFVNTIR